MTASTIQLALCADANYAPHLATTLQSIFQHNAGADLEVHLLCTDMDAGVRARIQQVGDTFGRTLMFHEPDISRFAHLGIHGHFSHAIYLRLLLPRLLPDISRLIYLDCDLLVEAPLAPLWAIDLQGAGCAGMPEGHPCHRLGVEHYVNSGVLLLNLDYWREHDVEAECIRWLESNRERATMPDQDAINVVLQGKMVFLEERWNLNPAANGRPQSLDANPQRILHFAGPYKPWHRHYDFRLADIYRSYRQATAWGQEFKLKEPETTPQALIVAHQLTAREQFQEAYAYFELALRLELAHRKLDLLLQLRVVNVARALAGAGDFRQACELQRASFEQWGFPHDYQGMVYLYEQSRRQAA